MYIEIQYRKNNTEQIYMTKTYKKIIEYSNQDQHINCKSLKCIYIHMKSISSFFSTIKITNTQV